MTTQKTLSTLHTGNLSGANEREANCVGCGKVFQTSHRRKKYCEKSCQVRSANTPERHNAWAIRNIERVMFNSAKLRASKKNLHFDIEVSDIVIPEYCPVLGIKLEITRGKRKVNEAMAKHTPSLDRIDPAKGYVKGNIRVISLLANKMKTDASPEELVEFAIWVLLQDWTSCT